MDGAGLPLPKGLLAIAIVMRSSTLVATTRSRGDPMDDGRPLFRRNAGEDRESAAQGRSAPERDGPRPRIADGTEEADAQGGDEAR